MVRFNIISHGFLNVEDPSGVAFKCENPFFRFADISLGRSTEFTVPATDYNRDMLGFGEDPAEDGEMLRRVFPAQMVYDGGVKNGTIAVTGFNPDAFSCVFTIGNADWIDALQNKKLSECVSSWDKGVLWAVNSTVVNADAADPTAGNQIIRYENNYTGDASRWQLVPSVNVFFYVDDILTNLGIPHTLTIPKELWMVSGSMKGAGLDQVTISSTGANNATISTQTENYLAVVDIDIEWATILLFDSGAIGGGSFNAKAFEAQDDIQITFPQAMPQCYLVKWSRKLSRYEQKGGPDLSGQTISFYKGEKFFFASSPVRWNGYQDTYHPYSFTVDIVSDGELNLGQVWYIRNNHPDMTVFEFLKSVCVATGLELIVDGENGVDIQSGSYGHSADFTDLDRVTSIDSVTRRVESWGSGIKKAEILFDSEDYVTEHIVSEYEVDNDQNRETKDTKSKFSEGSVGTNGVLIDDVDDTSNPPKFKAKKWTLALATSSSVLLQRIGIPDPVGYEDISVNSTAMQVRIAAQLAEFFNLTPSKTFTWRGSAFVWTDANWSDGILTMTLQRVSQMPELAPPT